MFLWEQSNSKYRDVSKGISLVSKKHYKNNKKTNKGIIICFLLIKVKVAENDLCFVISEWHLIISQRYMLLLIN